MHGVISARGPVFAGGVLSVLLLSACGGGGGGGHSSGGDTPAGPFLTFNPGRIAVQQNYGESKTVSIVAVPTRQIADVVYVRIQDDAGVITTDVSVAPNTDGSYTAVFHSSPTLAPGSYDAYIDVKVCLDTDCNRQVAGSPVQLPYTITVGEQANLKALAPLSGAGDWTTFQGNAGHTGYVPVTLNANDFSFRWRWGGADTMAEQSSIATGGDSIYLTDTCILDAALCGGGSRNVFAVSESAGKTEWTRDMTAQLQTGGSLTPPAFNAGRVVFNTLNDYSLVLLDASNGTDVARQTYGRLLQLSAPSTELAPVVDDAIYVPMDGVTRFPLDGDAADWITPISNSSGWTPAVDANHVYSFNSVGGAPGLTVVDKSSGVIVGTIAEMQTARDGDDNDELNGAPIVGDNDMVLATSELIARTDYSSGRFTPTTLYSNRLVGFDTTGFVEKWSVAGGFGTQPAVADGVVYVASNTTKELQARSQQTGEILWTWAPPSESGLEFYGNIIVTNNLVFASTRSHVFAIDRNTHQSVWQYWTGGQLAISRNGVLYIGTKNGPVTATQIPVAGTITAINLH